MATLSISALFEFFSNEKKSVSRGENHYKSGHVQTFVYASGVLTGKVHASMKNKVYNVKVFLNDQLEITSSTCECPRGTFKCSHAAALFIHAIHNLSRTDVECSWKRKRPLDNTVQSAEDLFPAKQPYQAVSRAVTEDDRAWLFNQLQENGPFTGLYWLMTPEPEQQSEDTLLPLVESVLKSKQYVEADVENKENIFFQEMRVSDTDVVHVAERTKMQRKDANWHLMRKGRITASSFGQVLKAKKATPSLMKRLQGEQQLDSVRAVSWGVAHEEEAIQLFEKQTKLCVQPTGIWLDPSGLLGASPDGLVGDDSIIEVKCPYTHREHDIQESLKDTKFCLHMVDGEIRLKCSHDYWHQVQGQLYLSGRQKCYFVVWTLKEMSVTVVQKDEFWKDNLELLKDFYRKHVYPSFSKN